MSYSPTRSIDPSTVLSQLPKPTCYRIKILSMGMEGVGKSCLIKRYSEERFVARYIPTIGVDYGVKRVNVEGRDVKVNFWDLSGSQDFFEVRNEFYKDTQAVILVFDVNNIKSFHALGQQWVKEAAKYGLPQDIVGVVVGNKTDVRKRVVDEKEARQWAQSLGYGYCEVSANTGDGVAALFENLFKQVVRAQKF
eukprot:PhM_4_TR515/c0_g1_i1/m.66418/K19372/DNAJC27; DnaJ homolog subfamily C member 27